MGQRALLPAQAQKFREAGEGRRVLHALVLNPGVGHIEAFFVRHEAAQDLRGQVLVHEHPALAARILHELKVGIQRASAPPARNPLDVKARDIAVLIARPGDHDVVKVKAQQLFRHPDLHRQPRPHRRRAPPAFGQSEVPRRQHHRDHRRAVHHGVGIIVEGKPLRVGPVDQAQGLVHGAPCARAHEDQVGELQLHARFAREGEHLVQRAQVMRPASHRRRIRRRCRRARPRVHREHPPVALRHPRRAPKLLVGGVAVRLVHQAQRNAARARLQRGGHQTVEPVQLLRRERPGVIPRQADAPRHVPVERQQVHRGPPACRKEAGQVVHVRRALRQGKQAAADERAMRRVRLPAEGRKAAVARHLRGDALLQKRREVGQGIGAAGKPVVVGMAVDEAGGHGQPLAVEHEVRLRALRRVHGGDGFTVDEQAAPAGGRARAVVEPAVLEKRAHGVSSFCIRVAGGMGMRRGAGEGAQGRAGGRGAGVRGVTGGMRRGREDDARARAVPGGCAGGRAPRQGCSTGRCMRASASSQGTK